MDGSWINILITVISALAGILVTAIGVIGGLYVKKLEHRLKMKSLADEINRYVERSENSNIFTMMSKDEKIDVLMEQIKLFAYENNITITDAQLSILIENSMKPLLNLNNSARELMKLKGRY